MRNGLAEVQQAYGRGGYLSAFAEGLIDRNEGILPPSPLSLLGNQDGYQGEWQEGESCERCRWLCCYLPTLEGW